MSRSVGGSASGRAVTWAWNLPHQPPPAEVRRTAAHHVLDALGCAVAGARSGAAAPVLTVAHRTAGWGPATLLDGNGPVTVEDAALGNGALIRCLDLDNSTRRRVCTSGRPCSPPHWPWPNRSRPPGWT